jgi:hypothetical protein
MQYHVYDSVQIHRLVDSPFNKDMLQICCNSVLRVHQILHIAYTGDNWKGIACDCSLDINGHNLVIMRICNHIIVGADPYQMQTFQ